MQNSKEDHDLLSLIEDLPMSEQLVFEVTIGIRSTNFGILSNNWYSK
jgi:hypothetical protein